MAGGVQGNHISRWNGTSWSPVTVGTSSTVLALAASGVMRDFTTKPLPRQILTYVMQDEARHVAFGRLALRDYYKQLSAAEIAEREDFVIEWGLIFANIVLADEINRAPAKVQSALLEAMAERHVTIAGQTRQLPKPFLVLATQNPIEAGGV